MAGPYPVRTAQRNLHHQLLRSGVLITGSSRAGMPLRDCPFARHEVEAPHPLIELNGQLPSGSSFVFDCANNRGENGAASAASDRLR